MALFPRFFRKEPGRRVFVLGLDGVPHSFLVRAFEAGLLPNLADLAASGRFERMTSVIPTVSSVAWSTYMTGKNPGKHGIYGFVDRQGGSYDIFVPTSVNMTSRTLWEIMGDAGRRVIVMNVPVTYPPRPVNGILVADFLCTNMDKIAYPPELSGWLKEFGYRIDADAKLARTAPERFVADVHLTLERRFAAARHLMKEKPWEFFQLHVMETDRVNHFLLPGWDGDPKREEFDRFYRTLDGFVGDLVKDIPAGTSLVVLSDHGFCPLKREVYLNEHLIGCGHLKVPEGKGVSALLPESRAYSLIPGRIYLNMDGREPRGSVSPADYRAVREEIARDVAALRDPDDGAPVIKEVVPGEELFHGETWHGFPAGMEGKGGVYPPDLVAVPVDGYDLKGNVGKGLFCTTELVGMHTYGDAFLMLPGEAAAGETTPNIADVMPTVLVRAGLPVPDDVDGRPLVS